MCCFLPFNSASTSLPFSQPTFFLSSSSKRWYPRFSYPMAGNVHPLVFFFFSFISIYYFPGGFVLFFIFVSSDYILILSWYLPLFFFFSFILLIILLDPSYPDISIRLFSFNVIALRPKFFFLRQTTFSIVLPFSSFIFLLYNTLIHPPYSNLSSSFLVYYRFCVFNFSSSADNIFHFYLGIKRFPLSSLIHKTLLHPP